MLLRLSLWVISQANIWIPLPYTMDTPSIYHQLVSTVHRVTSSYLKNYLFLIPAPSKQHLLVFLEEFYTHLPLHYFTICLEKCYYDWIMFYAFTHNSLTYHVATVVNSSQIKKCLVRYSSWERRCVWQDLVLKSSSSFDFSPHRLSHILQNVSVLFWINDVFYSAVCDCISSELTFFVALMRFGEEIMNL